MQSMLESSNPVSITWTEIQKGQVFVIALCRACRIVRERFVSDVQNGSPHLVALEALSRAGCSHAIAGAPERRLGSSTDLPVVRVASRPQRTADPPLRAPLPSVSEELGPSSRDPRSE